MKKILILGADRVMPKLFYFSYYLKKKNIQYLVYTHDNSPYTKKIADEFGVEIVYGPPHKKSVLRMLKDIYLLNRCIRRQKFIHAELYSDYHFIASFCYFIILFIYKIPCVLWLRGELYDWDVYNFFSKLYFRIVLFFSRIVILKENYMIKTLKKSGIKIDDRYIELHNSVPPIENFINTFSSQKIKILFLNMFKPWRNVFFCVEVAKKLKISGFDFEMNIVGEKEDSPILINEAIKLKESISANDLNDFVFIHKFTEYPSQYFLDSDIFILPADLIFCNYALLEAMSFGLIPIVSSHDKDYSLIIEDGVSGFGLPLDSAIWVETILYLEKNRNFAKTISIEVRNRIKNKFSSENSFKKYSRLIGID